MLRNSKGGGGAYNVDFPGAFYLEIPGQGVFYEAGNSRERGSDSQVEIPGEGGGVFLREVLNLPVRFKIAISH